MLRGILPSGFFVARNWIWCTVIDTRDTVLGVIVGHMATPSENAFRIRMLERCENNKIIKTHMVEGELL